MLVLLTFDCQRLTILGAGMPKFSQNLSSGIIERKNNFNFINNTGGQLEMGETEKRIRKGKMIKNGQ